MKIKLLLTLLCGAGSVFAAETEARLWRDPLPVPATAEITVLGDLRFNVIKPYEFQRDGYRFLHGVALCFHKGRLYASFGHNRGGENTDTEEARFCVSDDDGRTWGAVQTIDAGEGPLGVSHGAFLSHDGRLWAFQGAYTGIMQGVHTRAYLLDEHSQRWLPKGTVIEAGFWPMQEPQKMDDGNWIMAGLQVGGQNPAAVAISRGEDFTRWDVVSIPPGPSVKKMWGESAILVQGREVTSISRYGERAQALVARSLDYGRTWEPMQPSNLPMTTSKPSAGILSNGQRYLVCTTTADSGQRRAPLTLAVSRPGEKEFSKVFVIRHAVMEGTEAESHPKTALSYPYAMERGGNLYVGYSNTGGNVGRVGTGRELWNNNSAELAVIPVRSLAVDGDNRASLASRGLPRILFNNDSDDLKWPAYPEHHASVWVPAGKPLPSPSIQSIEDYLKLRIGPLAKTETQGLSYCGNFGLPIWELKRDHIAALGDDPLQPILQFWKRDGRTFFFSMRMNDMHHTYFNWCHLWDEFRRTHRHWFLEPPTEEEWRKQILPWLEDQTKPGPGDMWANVKTKPERMRTNGEAFLYDYSRLDVRAHYLELLREVCRRYDLDGIELDWLRYPKFFREGEVNATVLTEFVRDARAILDDAAKRGGHPVRLLMRVPDSPARASELGLDVEAWLKAGWLDAVIAGNGFTFGSNPLDQWVSLAHRHGVPVYGTIERMPRGFSRFGSIETLRAAAATLWEKGADGLYTFNFYNTSEYPLFGQLSQANQLARLPKEYFLDSCSVSNNRTVSEAPLPLSLQPTVSTEAQLLLCDDPSQAKEVSLEIVFNTDGEAAEPAVILNGQRLHDWKKEASQTSFTLALSSAALKAALKRGVNEFTFHAEKAATVNALSVRVLP